MGGLCVALDSAGGSAGVIARLLLDLSWAWLRKDIDDAMGYISPSIRDRMLGARARPLAVVLATAAALGSASVQDAVREYLKQQGAEVIVLELATLRAAAAAPGNEHPAGVNDTFRDLATDCATRLRAWLDGATRADEDWSVDLPDDCTCGSCATLAAFLSDPGRQTFEWPLGKDERQHIHIRIDDAEIPVTHVTMRQGIPNVLVLTKTDEIMTSAQSARDAAAADLAWLAERWNLGL
jgi:hypothetical protein